MIYIVLDNVTNLNDSLQVGDMIYATTPVDSGDLQTSQDPVGAAKIVGILREISESAASGNIMLIVDETPLPLFTPQLVLTLLCFQNILNLTARLVVIMLAQNL